MKSKQSLPREIKNADLKTGAILSKHFYFSNCLSNPALLEIKE
jgi:hypothetical protein